MLKIQIDTNVLLQLAIFPVKKYIPYFVDLYNDHNAGELQIVITKAVQAELYGLMRAERLERRNEEGKYVPQTYSHEEIMGFVKKYYPAIFDIDFLESLKDLNWELGDEIDKRGKKVGKYKRTLFECVKKEYGWDDWGEEYIKSKLGYSPLDKGKVDNYDYPEMATALLYDVQIIITDNLRDFLIPTGTIEVWNLEKASVTDHYLYEPDET